MYKKVNWLLERIFILIFGTIISLFIKRDKNVWLLGAKIPESKKDLFLNHTKYLFLYINNIQSEIKAIMLFNNIEYVKKLRQDGFKNVYLRNSIKGIYYSLKAKYWFFDFGINAVSKLNWKNSGIIPIHMWHGAGGLKKIGYDAAFDNTQSNISDAKDNRTKSSLTEKIYNLFKITDYYYIVNSEYEAQCRESAFGADKKNIKITGSPRLDVLYKDIPHAETFMEEDFENIKNFRNQGRKLIIYMPTFRDTGKDISGWLQSEQLQPILSHNNIVLLCKLHPFDKTVLNFEKSDYIYKIANDSDVYPILKYTDALITDYSSVYFDYLHLGKPIIYHIPDLEEYTEQCRGFYRPYETLTAGVYTKTEEELLNAILDVVNDIDNYKEQRKKLLDEMFVYRDGNNCGRLIQLINSLEEKHEN